MKARADFHISFSTPEISPASKISFMRETAAVVPARGKTSWKVFFPKRQGLAAFISWWILVRVVASKTLTLLINLANRSGDVSSAWPAAQISVIAVVTNAAASLISLSVLVMSKVIGDVKAMGLGALFSATASLNVSFIFKLVAAPAAPLENARAMWDSVQVTCKESVKPAS